MSDHVEKQTVDFLHHGIEHRRKLVTVFSWENGLVIDGLLHEGHDVVHVLRGGGSALLALVVHPEVVPRAGDNHVRAGGQVAELGDRPVHKVRVLEETNRVRGEPFVDIETIGEICEGE